MVAYLEGSNKVIIDTPQSMVEKKLNSNSNSISTSTSTIISSEAEWTHSHLIQEEQCVKFTSESTPTSTSILISSEAEWTHNNIPEVVLEVISPTVVDTKVEWANFLHGYSLGIWTDNFSVPPFARGQKDAEGNVNGDNRNYGSVGSTLTSSHDEIEQVYSSKGFLQAPIGPHEEERRMVCSRFGLDSLGRREALDRIAQMAQQHFKVPLIVISIVLDDKEIFVSTAGWSSEENDHDYLQPVIPLQTSICPHNMLRTNVTDECFIMEDASRDWRFLQNPHVVKNGGPVCFFASTNIFLPTSASSTSTSLEPKMLPVGSLCLIDSDSRSRSSFSAQDEEYLKRLADLLAREIQYGFDQTRQEATGKQTTFLGQFLRNSLVLPYQNQFNSQDHNSTSPMTPSQLTPPLPFQEASENLRTLTSADAAVILDLRTFNAPHSVSSDAPRRASEPSIDSSNSRRSSSPNISNSSILKDKRPSRDSITRLTDLQTSSHQNEAQRRGGIFSGLAPGDGSISILGSSGYDWSKVIESGASESCILKFLKNFYENGVCEFDSTSTSPSPLAPLLPPSTTAFLSIPIFDYDGKPALILLVASSAKYFRFESTDRQFVENVGAVAIGSLLRRRILEADRAKLAFVSQVSHELRTPLHAISSQLEMIRIVTAPPYLSTIKPLLEVAEVCVSSLREILDDTLTFAKMSNPIDAPIPVRKLQKVVLEDLVGDVIKSCWARTNQHAAIAGDENGEVRVGSNGSGVNLKISIEIEKRLIGCQACVDVGGLKRVLFNLVGNALKFTAAGSIRIIIKSPTSTLSKSKSTSSLDSVIFDIVDTGVGMSEEFLREQLFIPFRQQDSFSSGAGLGASICDNIVKRMNGTLQFSSEIGKGTTASVNLPLQLFLDASAKLDSTLVTRVISDELNLLLDPVELNRSGSIVVKREDPIVKELTTSVSKIVLKEKEVSVLVVDDNIIARKILTTFLSVKGVKYSEAADGLEAVQKFKNHNPNLVWCDIQMPIMDGLEATRQMRIYEQEHDLPPAFIVALSGLSDEDGSHSSALASGQISEWLTKGGRSLKILGEGLVKLQARFQTAAIVEAFAQQIRDGVVPTEEFMKSLASASQSST